MQMHALSAFPCMFVLFRKMMMVVVAVAVAVAAAGRMHGWAFILLTALTFALRAIATEATEGERERDGAKAKCIARSPSLPLA